VCDRCGLGSIEQPPRRVFVVSGGRVERFRIGDPPRHILKAARHDVEGATDVAIDARPGCGVVPTQDQAFGDAARGKHRKHAHRAAQRDAQRPPEIRVHDSIVDFDRRFGISACRFTMEVSSGKRPSPQTGAQARCACGGRQLAGHTHPGDR
jgi:hypothetical protein